MKKQISKKKKKVLISLGSILLALLLTMSIMMIVCVVKSKEDGTVPNGTLSMIGNFLRIKNNVDYATFDDEERYPVDDFRVSMSAMNHWENGIDYALCE